MIEWLLRKMKRTPPPPAPPAAQAEAETELAEAQARLRESEEEASQAHVVANNLRRVNRENHFAERALLALKGIVQ